MTGSRFAGLGFLGLGLLAAYVILFPAILHYMVLSAVGEQGCAGSGGGCGALATVYGFFLKPAGVVLICIYLAGLCLWRTLYIGIRSVWTLVCVFWLLGSMPYLVAAGNFWGANFSMGLLHVTAPHLLAYFIAFVVFLSLTQDAPANSSDPHQRTAWFLVSVTTAYTLLVSLPMILTGVRTIPYSAYVISPLMITISNKTSSFLRFGTPTSSALLVGLAILLCALLYILFRQNKPVLQVP